MPTTTSGFFLHRETRAAFALDLVVPVHDAPFGLAHHTLEVGETAFRHAATFAEGLGPVADVSLIQSNFGEPGNLEVVARIGDRLAAFWCAPEPEPRWSGPTFIASGATGNPALIQASGAGHRGDFQLIVPSAGGGIAQYWRDNDSATLDWHGPWVFAAELGACDAVAMIQSNYGSPGNLEVVARFGDRLVCFWCACARMRALGEPALSGPRALCSGASGVPALLQSTSGRQGNFELIAPLAGVGLGHWHRDNDDPATPWRGPDVVATGLGRCAAVSLLETTQPSHARLEIAVRVEGEVVHLVRDGQSWSRRHASSRAPRPSPWPVPAPSPASFVDTPPASIVNAPHAPPAAIRVPGEPIALRSGPHRAGFRRLAGIALSRDARYASTWAFDGAVYRCPESGAALLYYPASADGEEAALAPGGPFPVIAVGHERRLRTSAVRAGCSASIDQDHRQLAGIMAHLARWGFVVIAPDLSWLTPDGAPARRAAVLRDALSELRAGSKRPLLADFDRVGLVGHGMGALAAIALATDSLCPFQVRALALLAPLLGEIEQRRRIETISPEPVLIVRGGADTGSLGAGEGPRALYDHAGPPKHLVTIPGANHFGYTTSLGLAEPLDGEAAIARRDQQAIAAGYLAAFFNRYLRGARDEAETLFGGASAQAPRGIGISIEAESLPGTVAAGSGRDL